MSFGLEYEFNRLGRSGIYEDHAGEQIRERLRERQVPNADQWNVVTDGSCGLELVSPVLNGEKGLQLAKVGLDVLRSLEARTDRRCGLHIHFSTPGMRRYIRPLTKTLMYAEPVFFASTTQSRYGNHYCRFWDTRHLNVLNGLYNSAEDSWYGNSREAEPCDCGDEDCDEYREQDYDGREDKYHNSRYFGINLHSFFYGTGIELRYFHVPRTSGRLESWLRTVAACVEYARSKPVRTKVSRRLGSDRYAINPRRVRRVLHILKSKGGGVLSAASSVSVDSPATALPFQPSSSA